MKNIVLFGGSNSVMVNGLQAGLKEYANVTNLALGGSSTIQNLYELYRKRNQEAIKNADLFVTETNINDIISTDWHYEEKYSAMKNHVRNIEFFYKALYKIAITYKIPVCVIILPFWGNNYQIINNAHIKLVNNLGFNIINLQEYYDDFNLKNFGMKIEHAHQMRVIMRNFGKNIAKNIDNFKVSNKQIQNLALPRFKTLMVDDMVKHGDFKVFNPNNSAYNEIVYRLEKGNYLEIIGYENWNFIGLHSWNLDKEGNIINISRNDSIHWGSFIAKSINKISKNAVIMCAFCGIFNDFIISKNLVLKFNDENLEVKEDSPWAYKIHESNIIKLPYFDLTGVLLCSPYDEKTLLNIDEIPDDEIIKIEPELDFTHLVPNIEFFRDCMEFVDEYAPHIVQIKTLQADVLVLKNENRILKYTYHSATKRVQNYLSYKLGKAMIENSKSIFGYIKMPFVLWRIKKDHKFTQKINEILSLPKIETLPDYKEAIKYKNHLSYKLGQAMIKATKTWYKGGFIKLIFEIQKIKKEHKKKF